MQSVGQSLWQWQSFDEFWRMGGYGLYVWGSYGVTLLVMAAEAASARRRRRQAFAEARAESLLETSR